MPRREDMDVQDVIWEARASTHKWVEALDLTICERCLIVRRADGKHMACEGPSRLTNQPRNDSGAPQNADPS